MSSLTTFKFTETIRDTVIESIQIAKEAFEAGEHLYLVNFAEHSLILISGTDKKDAIKEFMDFIPTAIICEDDLEEVK